MTRALSTDTILTRQASFKQTFAYLQTQAGKGEYDFVLRSLPAPEMGTLLFLATGIPPLPYLLADKGYTVRGVSSQIDDTVLLNQSGLDTFGTLVTFDIADMRSLNFAENRFAAVVSLSSLDEVPTRDLPLVFAEMLRICAFSGKLILTGRSEQFQSLAEILGVSLSAPSELVGLDFDTPSTDAECQRWIDHLTALARQPPFSQDEVSHRQVTTPEGETYWVSARDNTMIEGLEYGGFEADIARFFERFCQAGDVVFDVGANVGVHTLALARLGSEVHAFEPSHATFEYLVRNVLEKHAAAYLNPFGLSNENKILSLQIGAEGREATNSFGIPSGMGTEASGQYITEKTWAETLDHYMFRHEVERLDLLKIDVEGWEERVVRGGIGALLTHQPALILEFNSSAARNANSSCHELAKLVMTLGYRLYRYLPDANLLEPVEAERSEWLYSNLIGIHPDKFDRTLARLQESNVSPEIPNQDRERQLLLEENRALQQRLRASVLDQEVLLLRRLFRDSELDRAARQEVIERLKQELDISEADRAARLEVIERLKQELDISEADRAARLNVIERLKQQLEAKGVEQSADSQHSNTGENTLKRAYRQIKQIVRF